MICILQPWIEKMYSKRLSYLYKTVKTATASSTTNHIYSAITVTTLEPSLQRPTTFPLECWNAEAREHRRFRPEFLAWAEMSYSNACFNKH